MSTTGFGILSFGAYLPRARLQRAAIHAANAWFAPGLKALAKGERAVRNWDEDSITMGVEAARDCLGGFERSAVAQLVLASTTLPFGDRHNAGVVANALQLPSALRALDLAGGQRAGSSALAAALQQGGADGHTLIVAADARKAKAASVQEMQYGDGAAALLVGHGEPLAKLLAAHSETVDFVHQYRMHDRAHDYAWEERWVRDEGYLKIVPRAVAALLAEARVDAGAVAHFCMPGTLSRIQAAVAKRCGLPDESVRDNLGGVCGDTGVAHPLLLLAATLEDAKPGDRILLAAFGEGCDALLFEVTPAIAKASGRRGVKGALGRRREDGNYMRCLAFNGLLDMERGMRAEPDKPTPLSVLYRNRDMVQGLVGGRCRSCGTVQYPRQRYCVNPECNALDSQDDYAFSERSGTLMSYTADALTYSPDPPTYFGMVAFDGGGRMLLDFTEVEPGKIDVGLPVRMVFRIKDQDPLRGFQRYFWKATPA
ncbi:MAG TPA: OB-fold domain-containing protein [Rubrivivax sp.]|nr:OB-fold domain-containing protein [Rubrivivax sp.]HPO18659.1 OB-fold domain-containing protein [Rubrivivax sp.]